MAGAGQVAPAGDRIVDRVQAGGADIILCVVTVIGIRVSGEPTDQVIKAGEELVGRQVNVGERSHGRAQPAHGGGRVDSVADDIADNQGDTGSGERDHIEPVAAHAELGTGGQVATGDLHRRLPGESLRQQAALQGQSGGPLPGVAASVVKRKGGSGGEFLSEQHVVLLERLRALATQEDRGAEGDSAGAYRHREDGVDPELADRGRPGRVVAGRRDERRVVRAGQYRFAGGQATG